MSKWQRCGLFVCFLTLYMLISYGFKPDLTLKEWEHADMVAKFMAFGGGFLLIFGKIFGKRDK
ncbi:MAG: hypothetical protein ACFFG0_00075 [Candidatus Thorarchaeota archaeon]